MKALVLVTDQPNGNGRVYPRAVMNKAIRDLKHPLRVFRRQQAAVDGLVRDIIGTGTIVQDGTNVYADIAFHSHSLQQQVFQNGLTIRTGGVGTTDPIWIGDGTNRQPSGIRSVTDFQLTGLFLTADPA